MSTTQSPAGDLSGNKVRTKTPPTVKSAYGAYYVDLLDIYLPVLVLPPALIYFIHPSLDTQQTTIITAAIFVASLLGRPLEAIVFGPLADRIGKTKVATLAMLLSGIATLSMGLLPGFEAIGWMSIGLFVLLRLLNGIFIGGQYSSALPLSMEGSPKAKRGFYGGLINSAFPAAYVTIAAVVLLLTASMGTGDLDSPYVVWGWRIPFIATGIAELLITLYYWRKVEDVIDVADEKTSQSKGALRLLLTGSDRKRLLQVFVLMNGMWLSQQAVSAVAPGVLGNIAQSTPVLVSLALMVAFAIGIPTNIATGSLSQKIGRKKTLIILALLIGVFASYSYYLIITSSEFTWVVYLSLAVCVVLTIAPFALVPSYISERFPSRIRASGYGISYSLALILPSFYAAYQAALANFMPFEFTPIVLVIAGAFIMLIGALLGPETKEVSITD